MVQEMVALRIWRFLLGYVRIRIWGGSIERFVNLATAGGIVMWNLRRGPDRLTADIGVRGFRRLRRIARRSRCRVHIEERIGLPFITRRGRGRHAFALGLAACVIVVWLIASRVWFIEVSGTDDEGLRAQVLEAAAESGLKPGASVSSLDSREVELEILSRVESISWVRLRSQGTRTIIDIIEKTTSPVPADETLIPSNLVARAAGRIVEVLVYMGESAVRPGDDVVYGQVLIEGRLKGVPPAPRPGGGLLAYPLTFDKPVVASGRVIARVTRDAEYEQPFAQTAKERTGRSYTRGIIRLGERDIIWKGLKQPPFAEYEVETETERSMWRNIPLPVERITETYYEIAPRHMYLNIDESRQIARDKALAAARAYVPGDADVVDISAESRETDSAVSVRVVITTLENIAVRSLTM